MENKELPLQEVAFVQRQDFAICPLCAAIKELYGRINKAQNFPHLAGHIPAWQEGARQLKALKVKGIQAIMDALPKDTVVEADVARFRQAQGEVLRRDDIVKLVQEESQRLARLEPTSAPKPQPKPNEEDCC